MSERELQLWEICGILGKNKSRNFCVKIHISFFYKGLECVWRRSTKEEQPTDVWSAKWIFNSQQMYDQLNEYSAANRCIIQLKRRYNRQRKNLLLFNKFCKNLNSKINVMLCSTVYFYKLYDFWRNKIMKFTKKKAWE